MNGVWAWVWRPLLLHSPFLVSHTPSFSASVTTSTFVLATYSTNTHIIMASNSRYYYSLPTEAPQRSRSGSRRPPLTPSTVSSPCLTTNVPLPRRDSAGSSGSPTKAHALLAKVVSSPTTPRGETPTNPVPSPTDSRTSQYHTSPTYSSERPTVSRSESDRYVRQYRQQGKQASLSRG